MIRLLLGFIFLGIGIVPVIVGIFWLPYDPAGLVGKAYLPPSFSHLCGTDWFGRDLLSRVMAGGRTTWAVSLVGVAAGVSLGTALGSLAGLWPGLFSGAFLRFSDLLLAFPAILLALLFAVLLGRGVTGVALTLALLNLPYFVRLSHAGALSLRQREFVMAAQAAGGGAFYLLARHILPNLASPLLAQTAVSLSSTLLAEASLSYLGLGVPPPAPSWGRMLWEAQGYLYRSPWPAIFPGLALASSILGLNILADFLRDYLDPQMRALILWRPRLGPKHKGKGI